MRSQRTNQESARFETGALVALLEPEMHRALAALEGPVAILPGMVNYHLGFHDASFNHVELPAAARGKRFRPAIAMLACAAVGSQPERAAPIAAAL